MPSLDSEDVITALTVKMRAKIENRRHRFYLTPDDDGTIVGATFMSHKKPKRTLDDNNVSDMAHELRLTTPEFAKLVSCSLKREDALDLMKSRKPR